jgi:signal transduction histidine kinase
MITPRRRSSPWLAICAIAIVAVSFVSAILVSQYAERGIEAAVEDITKNASPSVGRLGDAAHSVRALELQVQQVRAQLAAGQPAQMHGAADELADLSQAWQSYLGLPAFKGERQLQEQVARELAGLHGEVLLLDEALRRSDREAAVRTIDQQLGARFTRTEAELDGLSRYNTQMGRAAAVRVQSVRRSSDRLELLMGCLAACLAVVLVANVVREARMLERLQAAHDKRQAERSAELELFAARVAHDLRNPLTAALLQCAAGERPGADGARALVRVRAAVNRASQMIDRLYELARADAVSHREGRTALRQAISGVLDLLEDRASEAGLTLVAEDLADVIVAVAPGALDILVSNLVENALKYAGRGATVFVRAAVHDTSARVEVQDTGVGLSPQMQDRIFDAYVRAGSASAGGLGLGLATVKRITAHYGGTCGVQSQPDKGTVFWFELPLAPGEPPSAPTRPPRPVSPVSDTTSPAHP